MLRRQARGESCRATTLKPTSIVVPAADLDSSYYLLVHQLRGRLDFSRNNRADVKHHATVARIRLQHFFHEPKVATMASADQEGITSETPRSWLLFRPQEVTMSMPFEYRWEFTRRHPYYLALWESARRHHQSPSDRVEQRRLDSVSVQILTTIGVSPSVVPPDPRLSQESLGTLDLGGIWEGGAVAPAILRTLAQMLLQALPASQRIQLGRLLIESAEYDSQDSVHMYGIYQRLVEFKDAAWDTFPDAPVFSINLEAPQRAITDAVEKLVRQLKEKHAIPERRRREESLADYLAVWDLREGWGDGAYDASRDQIFRTIAKTTKVPISTVISRYRSAFRFLSGHDYTPALWFRLMGKLKLSRFFGDHAGEGLTMRRPWRSPNPRPVTEAVLLPGRKERESPEYLAAIGITASDIAQVDLLMDIETLIDRGMKDDDEIIAELELDLPTAKELVAEIRARHTSS